MGDTGEGGGEVMGVYRGGQGGQRRGLGGTREVSYGLGRESDLVLARRYGRYHRMGGTGDGGGVGGGRRRRQHSR